MKVYDLANELAEEIKKSEEYVTYRTAKEAINLNYELKKKMTTAGIENVLIVDRKNKLL